jgi:hypothetical protein
VSWASDIAALSTAPVTSSTRSSTGMVSPAPDALLTQARELYPTLTLEEYTAARLAVSEHGSGSPAELCAIIDAELNRAIAKGVSLFQHLTAGTGRYWAYSGSAVRVPASTRTDPGRRHVGAAFAVLRSGAARGIAQGAHRFFDPRAQMYLHQRDGVSHPLIVLEAWCYDKKYALVGGQLPVPRRLVGGNEAQPWLSGVGDDLEEWVGPVDGVDAYQLMLFRKAHAGERHNSAYLAARSVILNKAGLPPPGTGAGPRGRLASALGSPAIRAALLAAGGLLLS